MYYELYVDVFFMVNFTMDAILLILLKKLLACPAGYGRVFAGAATGAAMTCIAIVIFRKTPVLRFVVFHGVINVVMMKAGLGIKMGPGIVQRMGALVYRVISAGRCVPVRSTVYKAGKYVLFTGCNQLLPRVGNLENHFILFRERKSLL
mgnify:CR=1 FL=1